MKKIFISKRKAFNFLNKITLFKISKNPSLLVLGLVLCLSCSKQYDPIEKVDKPLANESETQKPYSKQLRIDMDKLDEEYKKLDPVVRKNYEAKENMLYLLTEKKGNVLYSLKSTNPKHARLAGELAPENPILAEFYNADLKDEEDKPVNFFEIDSTKQKQFIKAWTINNGLNLEDKIKIEPSLKDVIAKENKAFEESLQEVKNITLNTRLEENNRNINFDLVAEKMREKLDTNNQQQNNAGGRLANARVDPNDNNYINFINENNHNEGMYWSLRPYYNRGRFLLRLRTLSNYLTLWIAGSPGHTSIITSDWNSFVGNEWAYRGKINETKSEHAFTISAYTKVGGLGTVDGVQYEPFKVWSRSFYVCAPATSSYRWRWCCYFQIMRWEIGDGDKNKAINNAKSWLGLPYDLMNDKNHANNFNCSKLVYLAYKRANENCNLSTWYEYMPSPNSIFRDDECIVLSPELYSTDITPRPSRPQSPRDNRCFIAGTKITMADGSYKKIEHIQVGDMLKTFNGKAKVNALKPTPNYKGAIYSINGSNYFVTEAHPFMTQDGWKSFNPTATQKILPHLSVKALQKGDVLIKDKGQTEVLNSFDKKEQNIAVYNFEVDQVNEYFANDFRVHNK